MSIFSRALSYGAATLPVAGTVAAVVGSVPVVTGAIVTALGLACLAGRVHLAGSGGVPA